MGNFIKKIFNKTDIQELKNQAEQGDSIAQSKKLGS